jgi:hypothetical protein
MYKTNKSSSLWLLVIDRGLFILTVFTSFAYAVDLSFDPN